MHVLQADATHIDQTQDFTSICNAGKKKLFKKMHSILPVRCGKLYICHMSTVKYAFFLNNGYYLGIGLSTNAEMCVW